MFSRERPLLICPKMSVCSRIQELSEYVHQDVEDRKAMDFICLGLTIPESEKRIQNVLKFWQSMLNLMGLFTRLCKRKKTHEGSSATANSDFYLAFSL